jgi:hypothetical protein
LSEIDEELDEDDESRFMEIADEKPACVIISVD